MRLEAPPVSVVMPVYNQEQYVRAAIDSISRQTFADFELLVVDDGSSDGTAEALARVGDPRLRVLRPGRVGFLEALALGVREAQGKWVARMDSDDIAHPERLALQMKFLSDHQECVLVSCPFSIVTPNGKYLRPRAEYEWKYYRARDITRNGSTGLAFADPGTTFNRQRAIDVGLYDSEFENEKPLWYRLLDTGPGAVQGRPLHLVRWRLNTHSQSQVAKRMASYVAIRRKYDSAGAAERSNPPAPGRSRDVDFAAVAQCSDYYLVAHDYIAAMEIATAALRERPLDPDRWRLLARCAVKRRSLRFWRPAPVHKAFVPATTPW